MREKLIWRWHGKLTRAVRDAYHLNVFLALDLIDNRRGVGHEKPSQREPQ